MFCTASWQSTSTKMQIGHPMSLSDISFVHSPPSQYRMLWDIYQSLSELLSYLEVSKPHILCWLFIVDHNSLDRSDWCYLNYSNLSEPEEFILNIIWIA